MIKLLLQMIEKDAGQIQEAAETVEIGTVGTPEGIIIVKIGITLTRKEKTKKLKNHPKV